MDDIWVIVNHFKSKSGSCEGDPDTGDGQAACNGTRTRAALALARWLTGDPTRSGDADVLINPELKEFWLLEFWAGEPMIARGAEATCAALPQIQEKLAAWRKAS